MYIMPMPPHQSHRSHKPVNSGSARADMFSGYQIDNANTAVAETAGLV